MQNVEKADVFARGKHVGTIAQYDRTRTAFEYSDEWLGTGFSISPFSLPLEKKLFIAEKEPFEGLFGVFDDTLPDGWGRLLTNRYLEAKGIGQNSISPITRLCLLSGFSSGLLPCSGLLPSDESSAAYFRKRRRTLESFPPLRFQYIHWQYG